MQNISHLSPILPVRDMALSLAFYNKLGFKNEFLWEEPVSYAVLSAGENAAIHLSLLAPEHKDNNKVSILYIFVHDVDKMYESCKANGIDIHIDIDDRAYRMRDFEIKDPDGNLITFGKNIETVD
ncbi:MAG: VOC family protein [Bacteroidota bacterium]